MGRGEGWGKERKGKREEKPSLLPLPPPLALPLGRPDTQVTTAGLAGPYIVCGGGGGGGGGGRRGQRP